MATFLSMIMTSMDANLVIDLIIKKLAMDFEILIFIANASPPLEHILYIHHLLQFKKD